MCGVSVLYAIIFLLIPFGCVTNSIALVIKSTAFGIFIPFHHPAILYVLEDQRMVLVAFGMMYSLGNLIMNLIEALAFALVIYDYLWTAYCIFLLFGLLYLISTVFLFISDQRGVRKLSSNGKTIRSKTESRLKFYQNLAEKTSRSSEFEYPFSCCFGCCSRCSDDTPSSASLLLNNDSN